MPRPRRRRKIRFEPNITFFRPEGVKKVDLEESILTVDEFEAVRLKDLEGLDQEKAAKKMNISQPTFHRLIRSARKKIADAIVKGKAIKIEGGVYRMVGPSRGRGRGGMGGPLAAGPGSFCICPDCGCRVPHQTGIPCYKMKCKNCGSRMVRER